MKTREIQIAVTERIIKLMEAGVSPWTRPWAMSSGSTNAPRNLVSKKAYRGINILLLGSMGYSSPYWLTYKQARTLGGYVKKEEHGTQIVFWKMGDKSAKTASEEEDDAPNPSGKYFYLTTFTVFNTEQCDGLTVPDYGPIVVEEHDKVATAEAVISAMPLVPEIRTNGTEAYYELIKDYVVVPNINTFANVDEYYSTLFHELAHSTGSIKRLARHKEASQQMERESYSKEELTAELSACFTLNELGLSNDDNVRNSSAYLSGWISKLKEEPSMLMSAMGKASDATDWVFGRYEKRY